MTQQGKVDLALGWATISSLIGGLFSIVVLVLAARIARVAFRLQPIKTFGFVYLTLITCMRQRLHQRVAIIGMLAASSGCSWRPSAPTR